MTEQIADHPQPILCECGHHLSKHDQTKPCFDCTLCSCNLFYTDWPRARALGFEPVAFVDTRCKMCLRDAVPGYRRCAHHREMNARHSRESRARTRKGMPDRVIRGLARERWKEHSV